MSDKPLTDGDGGIPPWAILHVPHASTMIPAEARSQFFLSDDELDAELARMTDHATDTLFGLGWPAEQVVMAAVSRLVVDVERFEDDAQEPMAGKGMGAVYTRTADGQPLRRTLLPSEREDLLARWYRPHHRLLTAKVRDAVERYGKALIIDAHSFPHAPLPYEDPTLARPEICIGTDEFHTPVPVRDALVAAFRSVGFTVGVDEPFSGALVPAAFYRMDRRCQSLMIEVRRDLYVNDAGLTLDRYFHRIHLAIRKSLLDLFSLIQAMG